MENAKTIALILAIVLIMGLCCSCAAQESKLPIKAEVVQYYKLDEAGETLISDLFDAFDKEYSTLSSLDKITDNDMVTYAENISDIANQFSDTFNANYTVSLEGFEGTEKEAASSLVLESTSLSFANMDLLSAFLDNSGAEATFETALNLVNTYADFFYGQPRITDDDLGKLDEKFG